MSNLPNGNRVLMALTTYAELRRIADRAQRVKARASIFAYYVGPMMAVLGLWLGWRLSVAGVVVVTVAAVIAALADDRQTAANREAFKRDNR